MGIKTLNMTLRIYPCVCLGSLDLLKILKSHIWNIPWSFPVFSLTEVLNSTEFQCNFAQLPAKDTDKPQCGVRQIWKQRIPEGAGPIDLLYLPYSIQSYCNIFEQDLARQMVVKKTLDHYLDHVAVSANLFSSPIKRIQRF